jgi:hypothetical protein
LEFGVSEPMRITLDESTLTLIQDDFTFSERGEFDIKGFGTKEALLLRK